MTSLTDYQAARKRVEADLAFSEGKRFIYASPKTRDLRALLAGPPEPSVEEVAWQPIESAPRDGTDVMAGRPVAFGWTPHPLRSRYIDGRWRAQFGERDWRSYDPQPTHWMPIPPAPQPDE